MSRTNEIPLPDACLQLSIAYSQAYRLGLAGVLELRREGTRWMCTQASVDRLLRERRQAATHPSNAPAGAA